MAGTNVPRLNPPARHLGTINAVMGSAGRGAHHVRDFAGPLSIKLMVRGSGIWRTDAGVHHVEEGYFLVLNQGQSYSLDIDGNLPRESFCPFFRHGFVEDLHRTLTSGAEALLDDPVRTSRPPTFRQHLNDHDGRVVPAALALRRLVRSGVAHGTEIDELFVNLGEALLLHADRDLPARIARLPASRASTREECHRRVARGRDYLHANACRALTLADMAAHACMSPHHFHRRFKAVYGATPHQYLTRLRLDRARRLLEQSDRPVVQTALSVGFESQSAFTRLFTRAAGVPPGQYRRSAEIRKIGKGQGHSADA